LLNFVKNKHTMELLEIYNLYIGIEMKVSDAMEENYNLRADGLISLSEYENTKNRWAGIKLGAETLYKKIQELNKESVTS
jgi:hypothetical protein